jgi:hypothetical protein
MNSNGILHTIERKEGIAQAWPARHANIARSA